MTATQATRLAELQACMTEEGLDLFVVQDPDSMVAFAGFWNYLGMEFGRATLLAVPRDGAPVLIAPARSRWPWARPAARRSAWVCRNTRSRSR
jgi:Xaa-Pro aminopeptidase